MYKILLLTFFFIQVSLIQAQDFTTQEFLDSLSSRRDSTQNNHFSTLSADSIKILVKSIRNSDIGWDGNFIGYMPWSYKGGSSKLLGYENIFKAIPFLVEALTDSQRFISAHVLLTQLNKNLVIVEDQYYNGLQMELIESPKPPPENCLQKLKEHWKEAINKSQYIIKSVECKTN